MKIVIALGGNALLQRGEPLEAELQKKSVKIAAKEIAKLAKEHQLIICHGNGPQVGLLALQSEAYTKVQPYPLDVLDAQSQGMIGYLIQHELKNCLPTKQIVTLLTQIAVDKNDAAFDHPSKPIGPVYNKEQASIIAKKRGWNIAPDGKYYRRVVPSPQPKEILELEAAEALLASGAIIIIGGGGGIPVVKEQGFYTGIEAVIDKDNTASLIAEKLNADILIILTDVAAVYLDWKTPNERAIYKASPALLQQFDFAKGSMGPKIYAATRFVENTNKVAAIGQLAKVTEILAGQSGTHIVRDATAIAFY